MVTISHKGLIGKSIANSVKDKQVITDTTVRLIFALKAANIKPSGASLDAKDIRQHTDVMCGGVLVKNYAVYKTFS